MTCNIKISMTGSTIIVNSLINDMMLKLYIYLWKYILDNLHIK